MRAVEVSMFPELRSHKAVGPLPASVVSGTNADLIVEIKDLYLTGSVLDVTYGIKGGWWKRWDPGPDRFKWHDLAIDGVDFTDLPYPDHSWDSVCFDPPYVPAGTDKGTAGDFQQRFGIHKGQSLAAMADTMRLGLAETARVASDYLLVKCMDFTSSGHFVPMTYDVVNHAREIGLHLHDEIVHHAGSGPGGQNIVTPKRARRHHSKLLVFTWDRR